MCEAVVPAYWEGEWPLSVGTCFPNAPVLLESAVEMMRGRAATLVNDLASCMSTIHRCHQGTKTMHTTRLLPFSGWVNVRRYRIFGATRV